MTYVLIWFTEGIPESGQEGIMAKKRGQANKKKKLSVNNRRLFIGGLLVCLLVALAAGGFWAISGQASEPEEAPEAQKVLDVQADMPFQILIPAYLPKTFDRAGMEIAVNMTGPGGEAMVQLTYHTRNGSTLFIREWVPVNPDKEILAASRPIETKWGQGWLLRQGAGLVAIWVDIGPLRASIYTPNQTEITTQDLLGIAENMGPASNRQVFDFILEPPELRAVEPPPPLEIPINEAGIQEVDLIVTPGGYEPLRFSVMKDVPVRLTFRQLGRVGCGNELNLPYGTNLSAGLKLKDAADKAVFEFTPKEAGDFTFFCAHLMYKGIMTVRQ
jgi:hypothetical protein